MKHAITVIFQSETGHLTSIQQEFDSKQLALDAIVKLRKTEWNQRSFTILLAEIHVVGGSIESTPDGAGA